MLLYLSSSGLQTSSLRIESLAFLPQLLLSTVLIPLALAKKNLAIAMLAQTFAFVTFNKVCTSQVSLQNLHSVSPLATSPFVLSAANYSCLVLPVVPCPYPTVSAILVPQ